MANALRELFVKFEGEFDFEEYDKAIEKTERLRDESENTAKQFDDSNTRTGKFRGTLSSLDDTLTTAGVDTGILGQSIGALANPATLAAAAIAGLIAGFVKWLGVLKDAISRINEFVTEMADAAVQLDITSQRLGISAGNLEGWRAAAKRAGLEAETVDDAFTDLGEKIGEALSDPSSQAAKNFNRLEVELRNADGSTRNFNDIALDTADAIAGLENEQERLFFSNELMSDSGRRLTTVLAQGSGSIREQIEEVKRLNPSFAEYIDNAQKLAGEQAELNEKWEAAKRRIFNLLVPAVIFVTEKLSDLVEFVLENKEVQIALIVIVGALTVAFLALGAALGLVAVIIGGSLLLAMAPLIIVFGAFLLVVGLVVLAVQDFFTFLQGGESVLGKFLGFIIDIPNEMVKLIQSFFDAEGAGGRFLDMLSNIINGFIELNNAVAKVTGLPELEKVDLRQSVQEALPQARGEEEQRRFRERQLEGIRSGLAGALGVELDPAVKRQRERERQQQQTLATAEQTGLPPTIIPALTQRPQPGEMATGAARAGAEAARKAQPSDVRQENNQSFTINEATDASEVRAQIEEILNNNNLELQEVLGNTEG